MQPEYYVRFENLQVLYGHMKDGEFITDHVDEITLLDEFSAGMYKIQVETEGGEKYTLQTPEGDKDVLEYYETWNDDEFPDAYRGGSSLTRCN